MPRETNFGVFEMGMNHPGEIDALARLVQPDIAVITTIEPVHLGFFASVEAIADAKAEIFNGMGPRGAAVLNRDNPHYARLADAAHAHGIQRIFGFGLHADAAVRLIDCHLHATASAVTASVMGEIVDYCVAIPGRHWVMNSLAVLAAVKAAGGDVGAAAAALGAIEPMDGRGRRHRIELPAAAPPSSSTRATTPAPPRSRAALAVLAANEPGKGGRRIAVLGDMLELGADARRLHAELAGPIAEAMSISSSPSATTCARSTTRCRKRRRGGYTATASEMAELLPERLNAGDVVTVKGSYGSRMREVVARLLQPRAGRGGEGLGRCSITSWRRSPTSSSRSICSATSRSARAARW